MKHQKRIDIVVSIVAAILLWIYVITIVNPPVESIVKDVPVQITGQEALESSGYALAHAEGYTANVVISGPRNDIGSVKASDIIVTADVSSLTEGANSVPLTAVTPSGISLVEIQNSTVNITVDKYVTVSRPVEVVLSGAKDGQEATLMSTSLSQVDVSGAASLVGTVATVRVNRDLSDAELDQINELTLGTAAVDTSGKVVQGVKLAQEAINVSAVLFQTKTVPLEVPVTGEVWEGAVLSETRLPKNIVIKGPASALSQISGIKTAEIDIEGIYESTMFEINPIFPNGVFGSDSAEALQAEFIVADNGRLIFKYKVSDVTVGSLAEWLEVSFALEGDNKEITAVVSGHVTTLRTLAAGDVAPTANAEGKPEGEYSIAINPRQSISGLTVIYTPSTVIMKIKAK